MQLSKENQKKNTEFVKIKKNLAFISSFTGLKIRKCNFISTLIGLLIDTQAIMIGNF